MKDLECEIVYELSLDVFSESFLEEGTFLGLKNDIFFFSVVYSSIVFFLPS